MKIVVLDGYTLNPGDLRWKEIEKFGELIVHDRTDFSPEKVIETIGAAEIIFTNKTPLPKSVLSKTPTVKYIGVLATG
jgi:glycerate dehydrogenase